jgi:hypothetical protein
MKLQDKFPFDEAIVGLNNIYSNVGDRSHYINSESIQTPKKTLTKGKHYLIVSPPPQGAEAIVHRVKLLDAFYNNDYVYLFVINMDTERVYIIDICVSCPEKESKWVVFELEDQRKLRDYLAVKSYCEKC